MQNKFNKKSIIRGEFTETTTLTFRQVYDAYLDDMQTRCGLVGKLSGFCDYAEGWIRHNPIGFCAEDFDPLAVIARPAAE